jgi:hypothetical protein
VHNVPPELGESLSWRELWRSRGFALLELAPDSEFSSLAADRGLRPGIGQAPLEELDVQGVLQPVAFAAGGNPHEWADVKPFEPRMTFREEEPAKEWKAHAWDNHGRPHTSALYSPWQLLYLDNVTDPPAARVGLDVLRAPAEQRDKVLDTWRGLLEAEEARWHALDSAWRPLMKVLVRLQNRYLPEVTGQSRMLYDTAQQTLVDPWPEVLSSFDALAAASELGVSAPQLSKAYWFLVERGLDRDPRDGLELLRRARPRSAHKHVQGLPRRAQDLFDAAQVLRLFLRDLTGNPPERNPLWRMDGRQRERAAFYDLGPAAPTTREQLRAELADLGLYPHAVHLVGEGGSEKDIVHRLVEGLLGSQLADEIGFTDLGGSGSASRLPTMVKGFTTYAQRTVVIVDSEGQMAQYVKGLVRSGQLPEDDILNFTENLEDSNFSPAEMLKVLTDLAASPADGLPPVTLTLPLDEVLAAHQERSRKSGEPPGRAGTLLKLAQDPKYGGPVTVSKLNFARALADRMLADLDAGEDDQRATEAVLKNRPLLAFVLDRIVPVVASRYQP